MELYYITKSNHINTSVSSEEGWLPGGDISLDYTTDPNTRQLSITSIAGTSTNVTQGPSQGLLLYEDSGGNVGALLQVQEPWPGQGFYWLDVSRNDNSTPRSDFSPVYLDVDHGLVASSTLQESLPGVKLRAPFISVHSNDLPGPGLQVELFVCDDGNDGNLTNEREVSFCNSVRYITYQSWTNTSRGLFLPAPKPYNLNESTSFNYTSIRSFDFAYLETASAIWVNGTHVSPIGDYVNDDGNGVPQVSFPFARLASINLPRKSCYLYHQINGTTLAEEQYDYSLHQWLTTHITVPIPNTSVEDLQ